VDRAKKKMIIGIDASNIRGGGGATHLIELLRAVKLEEYCFNKVVVWGNQTTLDQLENRPWLVPSPQPVLGKKLHRRLFWQRYQLSPLARESGCDLLFVPGGSYFGDFQPVVTMCRNMLPFEWRELRRFGFSFRILRYLFLRVSQTRTFQRSEGLIFLTEYARDVVTSVLGRLSCSEPAIIPHGINPRFLKAPRVQRSVNSFSEKRPCQILYVSIINEYKHQWHVANAVASLRQKGLPVELELIGPAYGPSLKKLEGTINELDPDKKFIHYRGPIDYNELHLKYQEVDVNVFASSCENMPNILLEGMASGLPIACSERGPMREILKDGGVFFDPEDPESICSSLMELVRSDSLRKAKASLSYSYSKQYSWKRCAEETFAYLQNMAMLNAD
jgi:glycosyltransferase involved in cell wall biosynthesis